MPIAKQIPAASKSVPEDPREAVIKQSLAGFFDEDWYRSRYPDIASANIDPLTHFIRSGAAEWRDPNPFFDGAWYAKHYPDVRAAGLVPLLHYLQTGAAELRNPNPRFDAVYYVEQHPEAASNPLLYHLRIGLARGYRTERVIDITLYLPSQRAPLRVPRRVQVDVIIPVYRGFDETRACIDSVLEDSSRPPGRVIVIDDHSPDADLVTWLRRLAVAGRINLLHNRRNSGFVVSVNRGMQEAGDHDVLVLNSDTKVPPGWLRRLMAQAYASPRIATVSPLSNNATICGYPSNTGGPIALNLPLEFVDEACRTVNSGRHIDVPTTNGFCMYIRRQALRETGLFDAEHFNLGYGEENDFCVRASVLGWRHRIACDTFVFHQGSVSFGDRTAKLRSRAMAVLQERHPAYARIVAQHITLDSIAPFRFSITAALFRMSRLPVILMVTHTLGGGVQRHINELADRYRDTPRILLLKGTQRGAELSVAQIQDHPVLTLPTDRMDDLVALLQTFGVTRVHIHHLMFHDINVHVLIQKLAVPFDITIHDYYAICPQINLLPWPDSLYCGEPGPAGCNNCIAERSSNGAREILSWRRERNWQFLEAERVICPSTDVFKRLGRYGLDGRAVVAPHQRPDSKDWQVRVSTPPRAVLRIALIGVLADHKGARMVAALAQAAQRGTIELHLIGDIEQTFPAEAVGLIHVTGLYEEPELAGLLRKVRPHVVWLPSAAPETFSYTLSTAIDSGLPIVATNLGAFSERLIGRPLTWLVDHRASTADLLAVFRTVRQALQKPLRRKATAARVRGFDFYADDYLAAPRPATNASQRTTAAKPLIAILPERFDTGHVSPCAYIRLLQPLDHPSLSEIFNVVMIKPDRVLHTKADIIVTQRSALANVAAANALVAHARRTGAKLVYDLDDDLLTVPRNHPDAARLRPHSTTVRAMLREADVVFLSTHALADRLRSVCPEARVIENGLDERIWNYAPALRPVISGPVRVLCMGTSTHEHDLALILPALVRAKAEFGDRIIIDIIGMTNQDDLPPGLNRLGPSTHAAHSYPGFVDWLHSERPGWHIGLAPLLDTPFNACKSAIKAMDYAAMGLAVLASDMSVYRGSIADGPAGQLVPNNAFAWFDALARLVRDHQLRDGLGANARTEFLARSSLVCQAEKRRRDWLRLLKTRRSQTAA